MPNFLPLDTLCKFRNENVLQHKIRGTRDKIRTAKFWSKSKGFNTGDLLFKMLIHCVRKLVETWTHTD